MHNVNDRDRGTPERWNGAASLAQVNQLLADAEALSGRNSVHDGRLANERGFWVRVPGSAVHRAPPAGQPPDVPRDFDLFWKLAELKMLVRTMRDAS